MILEGHCQDAWSLVLILKPLELLGHLWLHVLGRDPYFLDPFLYHLGHGLRLSRVLSKVWLVEFHPGCEMMRSLRLMMMVVKRRSCLPVQ